MLWNLEIKHKLKHFLWKCLHGVLPVNEVIRRRIGKGEDRCRCCGEMTETLKHMFLFCSHAEFIWNTTSIDWDGLKKYRYSFWHWRNSMMKVQNRKEGRSHIALTVNILWQIWKSRNQVQFNEVRNCPGRTASKAVNEWSEYQEAGHGEGKTGKKG